MAKIQGNKKYCCTSRSAETVGTLAESSQTVNETKDEFQGMGSIIGNVEMNFVLVKEILGIQMIYIAAT